MLLSTLSYSLVIVSVFIMICYVHIIHAQVTEADRKLEDISSAILGNVENNCQCGFVRDRLTDQAFQCTDDTPEAVVYVGTIHGTVSVNSSTLVSHIEQWATDGAMVTILHEILNISNAGPSLTMGECYTEMTVAKEATTSLQDSSPTLNETQAEGYNHILFIIIGGVSAGGVIIIIIIMIVVIAVIVKCRHQKRGKIR